MRTLTCPLLTTFLFCFACQPMEPSGSPFTPARPEKEEAPPADVEAPPADPEWEFPEDPADPEPAPLQPPPAEEPSEELTEPPTPEAPADEPPTADAAPAPKEAPEPSADPLATFSTVKGWPIRLVSTIPDGQPPRAVLGMPDGEELVVNPGDMFPELGVVVMAIGKERLELAEIVPNGDHAIVKARSLTPLQ